MTVRAALSPTSRVSTPLGLAGTIVCLIGGAHLFLPTHGYARAATDGFAPAAREHFYFLGTYAIAGFLLSLGALSLVFSRLPGPQTRAFAGVMTLLWSARFVLELAYPVDLALFGVARPHPLLLGTLASLVLLYALATREPVTPRP